MSKDTKRNIRDSVFTHLFSDPEYVAKLYMAIHPEDGEISGNSIEIETLENVLAYDIYNDLGFTFMDRALIFSEAQSTWSLNIAVRMLSYAGQTYQRIINRKKLNVYAKEKVKLPKPEFYVIYTGDEPMKNEYISLAEEFFDGNNSFLDIKVKVILYRGGKDIIDQYIAFCKIYTKQLNELKDVKAAIINTIKICKKENVLKEYLEEKESEVYDIMLALNDDETVQKIITHNAKEEGIKEGIKEGRESAVKLIGEKLRSLGMSAEQIEQITAMPV